MKLISYASVGLAALALLLVPQNAEAGPIFTLEGGTLTATAIAGPGVFTLDVRGAALLGVTDTGLPLSAITVADITGGTDPTGSVLPFGNAYLVASDYQSGTNGMTDLLFFDFANSNLTGPTLTIPVYAAPLPLGSVPDAILATLVDASPVPFSFDFSQFVDLGGGYGIGQWQLASVGSVVPEPATWTLMFSSALLWIGARRRKHDRG